MSFAITTSAAPPAPRSGFLKMGTVYGTLLNFQAEYDAMASQMNHAPYKAPPQAPVLYVKPANTWSAHEAAIALPAHVPEVEIGATLGLVMGASPPTLAGYVLMNDLSVPHASYFRPPVKFKCLDGFLGVGPELLQAHLTGDPGHFELQVRVNGELRQTVSFRTLRRSPAQLLADVAEFMTLRAGDVLMLGCDVTPEGIRPRAKAGDRIDISALGLGTLTNTLVAEVA